MTREDGSVYADMTPRNGRSVRAGVRMWTRPLAPVLALALTTAAATGCTEGRDDTLAPPTDPSAASTPLTRPTPTTAQPTLPDALPSSDSTQPAVASTTPDNTGPERVGTFDSSLAPEASGIVVGRRDPLVRWIIDDDQATVLAIDPDGQTLGQVVLEGVEARDVEDIAIGACGPADPSPCVFVADIGDNAGNRQSVRIHRFPEPAPNVGTVTPTTATFTYDTGPVDAEALVVDAQGVPVVLTKEEGLTRLFRPAAFADQVMSVVATITIPPPATPLLTGLFGLTVTAADSSPDGTRLLLRTYDSVVELQDPTGGADLTTVGAWTVTELPAPFEPQGEAVAYDADGRSFVTVSEQSGDLWRVAR